MGLVVAGVYNAADMRVQLVRDDDEMKFDKGLYWYEGQSERKKKTSWRVM